MNMYPGSMDDYLANVRRDQAENAARRQNEAWLRDSGTEELIAAYEQGRRDGWGNDRLALLRTELNNRAHDGDTLAAPYRITDNY